MTKNEFIKEAALRLLTTWVCNTTNFNSKDVASCAKQLADEVWMQFDEEQQEDPEAPTPLPHDVNISVLADEMERIEKRCIEEKNEDNRNRGLTWRYQISGVRARFTNICNDTSMGRKEIRTVADLMEEGKANFMRRYNVGHKTIELIDKALENLYYIKSW